MFCWKVSMECLLVVILNGCMLNWVFQFPISCSRGTRCSEMFWVHNSYVLVICCTMVSSDLDCESLMCRFVLISQIIVAALALCIRRYDSGSLIFHMPYPPAWAFTPRSLLLPRASLSNRAFPCPPGLQISGEWSQCQPEDSATRCQDINTFPSLSIQCCGITMWNISYTYIIDNSLLTKDLLIFLS